MRRPAFSALLCFAACQPAPAPTSDPTSAMPSSTGTTAATTIATAPPSAPPRSAPSPAAPAAPDACLSDADCVATNFAGCCACPQCAVGPPHARARSGLLAEQESCKAAACNTRRCAVVGMCSPGEPAAHFAAHCSAGACRLSRR